MAVLHMLKSMIDTINTSFILQNGGSTIVIDGGFPQEAEHLHEQIKAVGGVVNGWYLTHIHDDHVSSFFTILETYDDIKVENVYYNFPSDAYLDSYEPTQGDTTSVKLAARVKKAAEDHGCTIVTVQKDDRHCYDGFSVQVLRTPDESITQNPINNASCVFRVEVEESGTSLLFLGDLGVEGGEQLLAQVPAQLIKADYVQMAHHGQNGVDRPVYEAIQPKYCLWCTPSWLWDNIGDNGYDTHVFRTIVVRGWISEMRCVKRHYRMTEGDQVIEL